jgi:hypothetical protein
MSEHAIASRVFSRLSESLGDVCSRSDVSCLVWGYGTRTEKKTLRRVFCVRLHGLLLGTRPRRVRTVRSELRPPRSGLPSSETLPVRTHSFDRGIPLSSTFTHIGDRHSPEGEASSAQGRREKPRPSYYPQSGGLDETHLQLHQDHQASRQTRLALHATLQVQRSCQIVTSPEGAPSCGTNACCGTSAGGVGGAPDRASCRTSYRTT